MSESFILIILLFLLTGPATGLAVGAFFWLRYQLRIVFEKDISMFSKIGKSMISLLLPLLLYSVLLSVASIPYIDGKWYFSGEVEHVSKQMDYLNTMAYWATATIVFPIGYSLSACFLLIYSLVEKRIEGMKKRI
jgi:hypothetical protein